MSCCGKREAQRSASRPPCLCMMRWRLPSLCQFPMEPRRLDRCTEHETGGFQLDERGGNMFRVLMAILLVFAITATWQGSVTAGGVATVHLDETPTGVVAGQPVTIGFTVM